MKKFTRIITRRSFVGGTSAIAGGLTIMPGALTGILGQGNRTGISGISAEGIGKVWKTETNTITATAGTRTSDKRETFILKELPDYYGKNYATLRIGMCQVYTEEWAIEANIGRTLEAIDLASEQGADIALRRSASFTVILSMRLMVNPNRSGRDYFQLLNLPRVKI